jgi:hypothetical protein
MLASCAESPTISVGFVVAMSMSRFTMGPFRAIQALICDWRAINTEITRAIRLCRKLDSRER